MIQDLFYSVRRRVSSVLKYEALGALIEKGTIYQNSYGKIREFKDKYKGRDCVLIGSGPSLTIEDLTAISETDLVSVACNSLFKAYELTKWRADLYCVGDVGVFSSNQEALLDIARETPFFVNETIFSDVGDKASGLKLYPVRVQSPVGYPKVRQFSKNVSRYVYRYGSVLYMMIQLAVYMGFDNIYLLGCDCNYSYTKQADGTIKKTGEKDYFLPNYESRNKQPYNQYDLVIPDYDEARRYADQNGLHIYNATRGGKLESFQRVSIDDVIASHRKG